MTATAAQRLEFAPVSPGGAAPSMGLALLVHGLLLLALTWGVQWRQNTTSAAVQAELWAALPVEAAPAPVPVPAPVPEPVPEPKKVAVPPAQPSAADIAVQREKARKEEQQRELALQAERKAKAEREKQRLEAQKKAEATKLRQQEQAAAKALEKQRQENLARMAGLAGASGNPNSTGTAKQSAGPSGNYAGRITARVKPNIVFMEDLAGNPAADVEVRCAPDGTIVGRRLIKSSGHKAWDEAVLKAIDKTERLPRDTDGSVYPVLVIGFRPKD